MVAVDQGLDALGDVAHLALGVEDQTPAVREVRPRSVHAEEVRELRHRDAEVCRRTLAPHRAQVGAVTTGDGHRVQRLRGKEPGRVDDHIHLVTRAVDGHDRVGLDVVDRGADQVDVVARERAQPAAVVLQQSLPGRRVVGYHLRHEFGIVAQLARDPPGQELTEQLVHLADREVSAVVLRVDLGGLQALVADGPEQQEAIPAP